MQLWLRVQESGERGTLVAAHPHPPWSTEAEVVPPAAGAEMNCNSSLAEEREIDDLAGGRSGIYELAAH